ncbi:cupin domain-containing protein [Jongsikchunia kroppenstedtii]|uniref:cupin domain-containing protein n=1 Tax=Jongsikchunia kroppenstedtii TaxID=1121721 RepID=UPI0003712D6B|nr:cupin domain-containing protein [Jongsikchunia kroppenstedtii]
MPHLTAGSAREFEVHGVAFRSFAATATGAAELGAWCAEFSPGTPGVPHRMSQEEVLFVVDGELDVEIDAERFVAAAGDAILVPVGALFRISNAADRPARAWVTTTLGMAATIEQSGERMAPPWAQ